MDAAAELKAISVVILYDRSSEKWFDQRNYTIHNEAARARSKLGTLGGFYFPGRPLNWTDRNAEPREKHRDLILESDLTTGFRWNKK